MPLPTTPSTELMLIADGQVLICNGGAPTFPYRIEYAGLRGEHQRDGNPGAGQALPSPQDPQAEHWNPAHQGTDCYPHPTSPLPLPQTIKK